MFPSKPSISGSKYFFIYAFELLEITTDPLNYVCMYVLYICSFSFQAWCCTRIGVLMSAMTLSILLQVREMGRGGRGEGRRRERAREREREERNICKESRESARARERERER